MNDKKITARRIVLTGGGSAGHVTPNLALIPALQMQGWHIDYIGSEQGVERAMIEAVGIPYHPIATGKLRRYLSWQNLLDPFKVLWGVVQAYRLLRQLKPQLIFSKGGFVGLPVVVAGWLTRTPIVVHESDFSVGLANRLSFPLVDKIFVTFEPAKAHIKQRDKVVVTGTPIRDFLFQGDRQKGRRLCGFQADKLCILIMGGGQGAQAINHCVRTSLETLTTIAQVIHLCGRGKTDPTLKHTPGYFQMEYADAELPDLLAASDLVISRAGANTVYELLALAKPPIFIPLPLGSSRGDQIQNACYYESLGIAQVIMEADLSTAALLAAIHAIQTHRETILHKIKSLQIQSATEQILSVFNDMILKEHHV